MGHFWKKLFTPRTKSLEIYTDGSWKGRWGAWAYVIVENGQVIREASGRERKSNSHRMEFRAAIEALQSLPRQTTLTLFSDSRELIDTVTLWIPEWKSAGWSKKNGRPIVNQDLIQILDALNQERLISWQWIKAHQGIFFNERCDQLCTLARASGTVNPRLTPSK